MKAQTTPGSSPLGGIQRKRTRWVRSSLVRGMVVVILVVTSAPALAASWGVEPSRMGAEALGRFHMAKPVSDPANGAWSLSQAEFYVAKLGEVAYADSESRTGAEVLARFHRAKQVSDPANGAWSATEAEFHVATLGGGAHSALARVGRLKGELLVDTPCERPKSARAANFSGDDAYDPAAGGTAEQVVAAPRESVSPAATSLSGDDEYDPAAGGTPELTVFAVGGDWEPAVAISLSGDDAYDPAAGGTPELVKVVVGGRFEPAAAGSLSGDDAYDPAAGGSPELSVVAVRGVSASTRAGSLSGDDAYDPAAGGAPGLLLIEGPAGVQGSVNCGSEAVGRAAQAVRVTYSGDDDYDPAAGGTPERSLFAFVRDLWLPVGC